MNGRKKRAIISHQVQITDQTGPYLSALSDAKRLFGEIQLRNMDMESGKLINHALRKVMEVRSGLEKGFEDLIKLYSTTENLASEIADLRSTENKTKKSLTEFENRLKDWSKTLEVWLSLNPQSRKGIDLSEKFRKFEAQIEYMERVIFKNQKHSIIWELEKD